LTLCDCRCAAARGLDRLRTRRLRKETGMAGEELTMSVRTLSMAGAKVVLAAAEKAAVAKGLAVSIAVVDNVGNLVSFQRVNNACVTSIEASIRKARTAANLSAPTKVFE